MTAKSTKGTIKATFTLTRGITNQEILIKMNEDMKRRGFSHWTKESYRTTTKHVMKYFKKPLEEVTIIELSAFFKFL